PADDPAAAEALREAQAALARGDRTAAHTRAQSVINSPDASPTQIAFALAVAGVLECMKDDIGGARGYLRRIPPGFRTAINQLVAGCRAHGQPGFSP
ncbi:MAG: hypothetical protein KF773_40960, partial [Deltaproteobacteria bacterium]|nr:hypothetical protein [Deltaproteobacteria bacterium]